ncbi:MAG: ABC transporter ATP-binding protein [Candidatus Dormibacteria bacterium]
MSALLEVQGVTVAYGTHTAVSDMSLAVSSGEVVGLIGPNGAGKTTLMDVIAGGTTPLRGRVTLDGADLTRLPAWRRARRGIGRTFQAVDLVDGLTVRGNLLLGCQARQRTSLVEDGLRAGRSRRAEVLAMRETDRVLELCGITADASRSVAELPLGRRRLVEIARALCAAPRLLLLDEAGSGMSADDLATLALLVRRLTAEDDLGVLLVEHDVEFVFGICDFVYVMQAGRLIARGDPAFVRRHPDVIHAYTGEESGELVAAAG